MSLHIHTPTLLRNQSSRSEPAKAARLYAMAVRNRQHTGQPHIAEGIGMYWHIEYVLARRRQSSIHSNSSHSCSAMNPQHVDEFFLSLFLHNVLLAKFGKRNGVCSWFFQNPPKPLIAFLMPVAFSQKPNINNRIKWDYICVCACMWNVVCVYVCFSVSDRTDWWPACANLKRAAVPLERVAIFFSGFQNPHVLTIFTRRKHKHICRIKHGLSFVYFIDIVYSLLRAILWWVGL